MAEPLDGRNTTIGPTRRHLLLAAAILILLVHDVIHVRHLCHFLSALMVNLLLGWRAGSGADAVHLADLISMTWRTSLLLWWHVCNRPLLWITIAACRRLRVLQSQLSVDALVIIVLEQWHGQVVRRPVPSHIDQLCSRCLHVVVLFLEVGEANSAAIT